MYIIIIQIAHQEESVFATYNYCGNTLFLEKDKPKALLVYIMYCGD